MSDHYLMVWTAESIDDGEHWGEVEYTGQPPRDRESHQTFLFFSTQCATPSVRAAENDTLVGVFDRYKGGEYIGFWSCDQSVNPVAHGERDGIIFRRGEHGGSPEWL